MKHLVLDFNSYNKQINEAKEDNSEEEKEEYKVCYITNEEAIELFKYDNFNKKVKSNIHEEIFETQQEADAFEKGLNAAKGIDDVMIIDESDYIKVKKS